MNIFDAHNTLLKHGIEVKRFNTMLDKILDRHDHDGPTKMLVTETLAALGFQPELYSDNGLYPAARYIFDFRVGIAMGELDRRTGQRRRSKRLRNSALRTGYLCGWRDAG